MLPPLHLCQSSMLCPDGTPNAEAASPVNMRITAAHRNPRLFVCRNKYYGTGTTFSVSCLPFIFNSSFLYTLLLSLSSQLSPASSSPRYLLTLAVLPITFHLHVLYLLVFVFKHLQFSEQHLHFKMTLTDFADVLWLVFSCRRMNQCSVEGSVLTLTSCFAQHSHAHTFL